jgi:hypothetical protein
MHPLERWPQLIEQDVTLGPHVLQPLLLLHDEMARKIARSGGVGVRATVRAELLLVNRVPARIHDGPVRSPPKYGILPADDLEQHQQAGTRMRRKDTDISVRVDPQPKLLDVGAS